MAFFIRKNFIITLSLSLFLSPACLPWDKSTCVLCIVYQCLIHSHTHTHTHTHTHARTHVHAHTHTHAHTHSVYWYYRINPLKSLVSNHSLWKCLDGRQASNFITSRRMQGHKQFRRKFYSKRKDEPKALLTRKRKTTKTVNHTHQYESQKLTVNIGCENSPPCLTTLGRYSGSMYSWGSSWNTSCAPCKNSCDWIFITRILINKQGSIADVHKLLICML